MADSRSGDLDQYIAVDGADANAFTVVHALAVKGIRHRYGDILAHAPACVEAVLTFDHEFARFKIFLA